MNDITKSRRFFFILLPYNNKVRITPDKKHVFPSTYLCNFQMNLKNSKFKIF